MTQLRLGPLLSNVGDAVDLSGDLGARLEAHARIDGHVEYPSARLEERKLFGFVPCWVPVVTTESKDVRLFDWSMNMGDIKLLDYTGASGSAYIPRELQTDMSDTSRAPWEVSSIDLIQWAMPSAMTNGLSSICLMTDGSGGNQHGIGAEMWVPLPTWYAEYTLDTTASPSGHDITEAVIYAGADDARANQGCKFSVRLIGDSEFQEIGTFENAPFGEHTPPGNYATKLSIHGWDGPLVTGVEAVRFDFIDAVPWWGNGSVWREFDVFGMPTGGGLHYATSPDGISNWTPVNTSHPDTGTLGYPVFQKAAAGEWDSNTMGKATVIRLADNEYHMWYGSGKTGDPVAYGAGIGYATSTDGIVWTRDEDNPLLHYTDGPEYRSKRCYTPWVFIDGLEARMYFSAENITGGADSIGLATAPIPEPATMSLLVLGGLAVLRRGWIKSRLRRFALRCAFVDRNAMVSSHVPVVATVRLSDTYSSSVTPGQMASSKALREPLHIHTWPIGGCGERRLWQS